MKKKFDIKVDCANCAMKIENALNKREDIESVKLNFVFGKMTVEAENIDDKLVASILKEGKKIDSDFEIL